MHVAEAARPSGSRPVDGAHIVLNTRMQARTHAWTLHLGRRTPHNRISLMSPLISSPAQMLRHVACRAYLWQCGTLVAARCVCVLVLCSVLCPFGVRVVCPFGVCVVCPFGVCACACAHLAVCVCVCPFGTCIVPVPIWDCAWACAQVGFAVDVSPFGICVCVCPCVARAVVVSGPSPFRTVISFSSLPPRRCRWCMCMCVC